MTRRAKKSPGKQITACFGGRKPYTEGLNLEAAGLQTDDRGRIAVNDQMQTAVGHIYAIGDVVRGAMLAHKRRRRAWSRPRSLPGSIPTLITT